MGEAAAVVKMVMLFADTYIYNLNKYPELAEASYRDQGEVYGEYLKVNQEYVQAFVQE